MNPAFNPSRNKQNYLAAKAAFNARDIAACVAHYAPDHKLIPPAGSPPPSIKLFFEQTIATWPDIQINVAHAVAEDDWVMGRSIARATHAVPLMGIAPTHKIIETTFWDLHRFNAEGLMVETWNLMDGLSIMRQLGALPSA
ncbi:MAG: ester cyclase [Caulobacteraceae bacterium]|nr:ester cyclase [Caulobacteraceae bacterium]